ncbi:MAG: helix-turn-helix domain-containing protein [Candidatus Diapherotrites archaeon]|uniref:Helix-turn-helix domain-containing protein n=1 Tax=Candidatus Iainarchaeum sp. TaxID=3101447 RepID=A0A8T3YMI6_9ARCH|nr:helix-turn-helix domain-containing protein [Candidatus Diapherotrites archaeon]
MWSARFRLNHADCPIVSRARKFGATVFSYPLDTHTSDGSTYVSQICKVFGGEESKLDYILDLRKDRHLCRFEMPEKDVFAYQFRLRGGEEYAQLYFNDGLMLVAPPLNSPDNHEYWEVASWDKGRIRKFHDDLSAHMDSAEMLGIANRKMRNIYFPNVLPSLSPSQQKALELASLHGYYSFPRRANLQKLAKIANVKVATLREHLRKAENKLMPLLTERISRPEEG